VSQDNLLCAVSGRVARITLNRPEFRNALSYDLIELLIRMLRTSEADTNVKCILIQGVQGARQKATGADSHMRFNNPRIERASRVTNALAKAL
jgi:enoyl-CoA hydratase